MNCRAARIGLPTSHDGVDVERIYLHPVAGPSDALRRNDCRSPSQKWIKNDVAAGRAVEDRVCDKPNWLYGRMNGRQVSFVGGTTERIGARICPDVAAVSAELTKLDVVAMAIAPSPVHENKFVLAPIERAHPRIVLGPDAEV